MRAVVVSGSRADLNCQTMVHEALIAAGHDSQLFKIRSFDDHYRMWIGAKPDVAFVAGDRIEILKAAVELNDSGVPIAHVSGGDTTLGSNDDRYRDAITALSCIHYPETERAANRLVTMLSKRLQGARGDRIYMVGCPGLDLVVKTPVDLDKSNVLSQFAMRGDLPVALVVVHPETVGTQPLVTAWAVCSALTSLEMQCICLGANLDRGGAEINLMWADWCRATNPMRSFHTNVAPSMFYALMKHCDVMVGNSSAMLTEAPSFGLNCVLVGKRQDGRVMPGNVIDSPPKPSVIARHVMTCVRAPRFTGENPYGDGRACERIISTLDENAWRWSHHEMQPASDPNAHAQTP